MKFEVHVPLGTNFVRPESRHKLLQFTARTNIICELEKCLEWVIEDEHCACSGVFKSKLHWSLFVEVFYLLAFSLSGLLHPGKFVTNYISIYRVLVEISLYPTSALHLINNEVICNH